MKKVNVFDCCALLYLYIPIIVFSLTWLNLLVGIPVAIICSYFVWTSAVQSVLFKVKWRRIWPYFVVTVGVIICWALLSGLGGFFAQSYDWQKHNLLLKGFIDKPWPVHYVYHGKSGVVSYYIAEYLLPGLVGKIAGFNAAQFFLLCWMVLGLILLVISIYKWVGVQKGWILLLIIFSLILFTPFIYPLNGIYASWQPADTKIMGDIGEWYSKGLKLQYSSNISLLRFVFPQFVPVALSVSLWLQKRKQYQMWGILLAPIVLYSTFTFLGLAAAMVLLAMWDLLKDKRTFHWQRVLSVSNLLAIVVMIVLLLYIACNILQPKPASDSMHLALIDVWHHKLGFITFQASWIIWALLLLKGERCNPLLYVASVMLFILPFFEFGAANDLVMRVSVPALMIINFLVIKDIALNWRQDLYYAAVLVGGLIIAGAGPLWQLRNTAAHHTIHHQTYNMPYQTIDEFFHVEKQTVYQYVDWSQSGLRHVLIRK